MKKQDYQKLANKICLHFGMNPIPITFYRKKHKILGTYNIDKIKLNIYSGNLSIHTLFHELAHYLDDYRFKTLRKGYYKMMMCNSMQPCKDHPGWFAATGPLKSVYFKMSVHRKAFKQCYLEIVNFWKSL